MITIQVIDDDHWCGEAIVAFLMDVAGGSRFDIKNIPSPDDGRDIYIVDNEFEDGDHGIEMVSKIRERNPDATIILCTATSGRIDATTAMNAGCNAMVEKGSAPGRDTLARFVRRHVATRAVFAKRPGITTAVSDIKSIISAWNTRMDQEDRRDEPAA